MSLETTTFHFNIPSNMSSSTGSDHPVWYKKLTDFPSNKENPFLEQAVAEMKVSVKRQVIRPKHSKGETSLLLVDEAGKEHGEATFVRQIEVDEEEFTKLFKEGVPKITGLSTRGTKVWAYVCDQLRPGATTIHFMFSQCLEHTGYKARGNVLSGLGELLEADIIARSQEASLYFINPTVMFNGNRITFAKTYVIRQLAEITGEQLSLGFNPSLTQLRDMMNEQKKGAKSNKKT